MSYIVKRGVKCHWNFFLLPSNYCAITLFGHVFFNRNKKELEEYLKTYSGEVTINHERIHLLQAEELGNFKFYMLYLYYWIIGLFKYGVKDNRSYYNIPFEREAYRNEYNFAYSKTKW